MRKEASNNQVTLRRYDLVDIPFLFEAACESIDALSQWLPWCHEGYSLEESVEWVLRCRQLWEQGQEYHFGIFHSETDIFLGGVGLNQLDRQARSVNLGYWVRTSWNRRGVATSAVKLAALAAFEDLHLNEIYILVALKNAYSQSVAKKLGGRLRKVLPSQLLIKGQSQDALLFSLKASDLETGAALSPHRIGT